MLLTEIIILISCIPATIWLLSKSNPLELFIFAVFFAKIFGLFVGGFVNNHVTLFSDKYCLYYLNNICNCTINNVVFT